MSPWKLGESHRAQSWKTPHKKLVFCFAHRNPRSFPRPSPLPWKIILNYEFCIQNQTATAQQNPVYDHSILKTAGWFAQSITKTTSLLLYHLVWDQREGGSSAFWSVVPSRLSLASGGTQLCRHMLELFLILPTYLELPTAFWISKAYSAGIGICFSVQYSCDCITVLG